MQKYQSHKVVEAAKILEVAPVRKIVRVYEDSPDGYVDIRVPEDFFARGTPAKGDYLVRYQPDGYLSWSPRAAFEAGYTLVRD